MAIINLAYTGYVNPEGASTILTEQQVWAGLQRKVRRGQDFVPVILGTTVYSETRSDERSHPNVPPGSEVVVREALFAPGQGPNWAQMNDGKVQETCVLYPPQRVDFFQPDGSFVSNIVSQGNHGKDDLRMTYTFSWKHGEFDETRDKVAVDHIREKYRDQAKMAVEKTIENIRQMVEQGTLEKYEVVRK